MHMILKENAHDKRLDLRGYCVTPSHLQVNPHQLHYPVVVAAEGFATFSLWDCLLKVPSSQEVAIFWVG